MEERSEIYIIFLYEPGLTHLELVERRNNGLGIRSSRFTVKYFPVYNIYGIVGTQAGRY
jgi:hypothetical protein